MQQDDGNVVLWWGNFARWTSGYASEPLATSPCRYPEMKTRIYRDIDLPGGDYKTIALGQPRGSWCGYFCAQESACKAWTYVPPGVQGSGAYCWLKNRVPNFAWGTGMSSGIVSGR